MVPGEKMVVRGAGTLVGQGRGRTLMVPGEKRVVSGAGTLQLHLWCKMHWWDLGEKQVLSGAGTLQVRIVVHGTLVVPEERNGSFVSCGDAGIRTAGTSVRGG